MINKYSDLNGTYDSNMSQPNACGKLRPLILYTGSVENDFTTRVRVLISELSDKFEFDSKNIVPHAFGSATSVEHKYDVAFIIVDQPSFTADDALHLPNSITFIIRKEQPMASPRVEHWSNLKRSVTSAVKLSTYRMLDELADGRWSSNGNFHDSFTDIVYSNIPGMWAGWKWADELETNMKVISTYAKTKQRTCTSMAKKMIYPFDTRSEQRCNNIIIIDPIVSADTRKSSLDGHPMAHIIEAAQTKNWDEIIPRSSLLIVLLTHKSGGVTWEADLLKHEKYAKDYNVDVFTILRVSNTDGTQYSSAFKLVKTHNNCMIISEAETNNTDWSSHVTTAIGAIKLNHFQKQYGAVTADEYKKAVVSTSAIMKNVDMTSKCVVDALTNV